MPQRIELAFMLTQRRAASSADFRNEFDNLVALVDRQQLASVLGMPPLSAPSLACRLDLNLAEDARCLVTPKNCAASCEPA